MDFDEKYLDELLKAVEPITGPLGDEPAEGSKPDDSVPDMAEEELDKETSALQLQHFPLRAPLPAPKAAVFLPQCLCTLLLLCITFMKA